MTDLTRKRLQAAEAKVRHAKESLEAVQKAVHDLHMHKQPVMILQRTFVD